jgi:hypothetical protein
VIDGVKENKKVSDTDLDELKKVYSFCNWTTSHAGEASDTGLNQLRDKISKFTEIHDRNVA